MSTPTFSQRLKDIRFCLQCLSDSGKDRKRLVDTILKQLKELEDAHHRKGVEEAEC